jgi:hypothetical protein
MEVETMRRMVCRWEDDQEVSTVITDQDSKLTKLIREPRWDVDHEIDANHAKKSLDRHEEHFPKEERQHLHGLGRPLRIGSIMCCISRYPERRGSKRGKAQRATTAGTTPGVTIQHTKDTNGDIGTIPPHRDSERIFFRGIEGHSTS